MFKHYIGFTLLELMLALTLSSLLMLCLVEVYSQTQRRYIVLMEVSHRQLRGDYAICLIEQHLKQVSSCEVKAKIKLSSTWRRRLKPLSDVIICKLKNGNYSRFYVTNASWQHQARKVPALFEKINTKPRLELVPFVSGLKASVQGRLLMFTLTVNLAIPVLLPVKDHYRVSRLKLMERQWYGTEVLPKQRKN